VNGIEKDIWHRHEFRERLGELTSRDEFEKSNGLKQGTLASRFRDYADRVQSMCPLVYERWRSGLYRENIYVTKELEDFLGSITGHGKPRTPAEVAAADVARREEGVKRATKRRDDRQEDLDKAQRYLDRQLKMLKQDRERLALETGQPVI